MRYFFSVLNETEADETGVELDSLDDAKRHAFDHARDILADHRADETFCESLSMLVTDETGRRVYQLSISGGPGMA